MCPLTRFLLTEPEIGLEVNKHEASSESGFKGSSDNANKLTCTSIQAIAFLFVQVDDDEVGKVAPQVGPWCHIWYFGGTSCLLENVTSSEKIISNLTT